MISAAEKFVREAEMIVPVLEKSIVAAEIIVSITDITGTWMPIIESGPENDRVRTIDNRDAFKNTRLRTRNNDLQRGNNQFRYANNRFRYANYYFVRAVRNQLIR